MKCKACAERERIWKDRSRRGEDVGYLAVCPRCAFASYQECKREHQQALEAWKAQQQQPPSSDSNG